MKKVGLQRLESFLRNALRRQLTKDLRDFRMVKEADLECCVYYHLRRFLSGDEDWRFFARKHSRHTGHFIDLLGFRKQMPRIAIELKWDRRQITKKDRRSLRRGIKRLRVNKAYFIATSIRAQEYSPVTKSRAEKHRLFEIFVELPLSGAERKNWKEERKKYTSRMSRRQRRRPPSA